MSLNSIAFIPDGNRRFAAAHNLSLFDAYRLGTQKSWEVMDWMVKYPHIRVGTFYTLSLENITRSSAELHVLFKIFENEADKILEKEIYKTHDLAINFLGRIEKFPQHLQEKMQKIQDVSKDYGKRVINVAIGYNGRAEIIDAAKKFALAVKENPTKLNELNEETFKQYLYNDFADPDMIVRTGYTQRLSGFLTYQSVYSELYFLDKYWPEFSAEDLDVAVEEFNARTRRFGK
ncbi:MAG: di-trans,poly-cis-decaprenylcistransferase [Candidatus Iainarchaeum archaeon]|uniref:Tritrans,polycis-undecaprenyl-diphosphate synthase (geranylgeranyl-diphosphate specific) n=1 Tax=Candidatus Iainarchaeum sp. TaxID=3101447 RepID=A0A7T9DJ09_9ARCH|nr:MAG: di-trans,poly-cis-decaprenylcistransferase [Candidatus Diapherotrites archaeon]